MLTRFSTVTCPQCGKTGKPLAVEPGSDAVENTLSAIPFIGAVGAAYTGWRRVQATLACPHCNHVLTESIAAKTARQAVIAKDKLSETITELRSPRFCAQCGKQLRPAARFCDNCGAAVPDTGPA